MRLQVLLLAFILSAASDAPAHDLRFERITFSHTEWQPPSDYGGRRSGTKVCLFEVQGYNENLMNR